MELDDLDRRILKALQENARKPFAKIASEMGVSEGTVHSRVKRLMAKGVIRGFRAELAPEALGRGLTAIVCIKADPVKGREALDKIAGMSDVAEVYDVTGDYYAVVKVRTKGVDSLRACIDKISEIDGITSTHTMIVLRTVKEQTTVNI